MIFGLIKKSYETVMENPSITLYFVLYLIVLNFLAAWVITSNNINASITLIVASMLLSMAFSSGWFQVFFESVDKDKIKEKNYFSIFLEGMGKNIIPVTIASIIFAFVMIGVIILSSVILNLLYENFDSILKEIIIIASGAPAGDFMKSLSENQKYMLYIWQMVINLLSAICIFIFMYYFPSIIKSNCENMFLKPFYELRKREPEKADPLFFFQSCKEKDQGGSDRLQGFPGGGRRAFCRGRGGGRRGLRRHDTHLLAHAAQPVRIPCP